MKTILFVGGAFSICSLPFKIFLTEIVFSRKYYDFTGKYRSEEINTYIFLKY